MGGIWLGSGGGTSVVPGPNANVAILDVSTIRGILNSNTVSATVVNGAIQLTASGNGATYVAGPNANVAILDANTVTIRGIAAGNNVTVALVNDAVCISSTDTKADLPATYVGVGNAANGVSGTSALSFTTSLFKASATNIELGLSSVASGGNSVVDIGTFSKVEGNYGIAIGADALSGVLDVAHNDIAIGSQSKATGGDSLAFGRTTNASGAGSLAAGYGSTAAGLRTVAVGYLAVSTGPNGVAIGPAASVLGNKGISVGWDTQTEVANGIAIGVSARGLGLSAIAIGRAATIGNAVVDAIAIGNGSVVGSNYGIAIGSGATKATNPNSVSIGSNVNTTYTGVTAIGTDIKTAYAYHVAVGANISANGINGVEVGSKITVANVQQSPIAIGSDITIGSADVNVAARQADYAIAIGSNVVSNANGAMAIGRSSYVESANAIAIGRDAYTSSIAATALGYGARVETSVNGVALGTNAHVATGDSAVAIGGSSESYGVNGVALGFSSYTGVAANAVALGAGTAVESARALAVGTWAHIAANAADSVAIGFNAEVADGAFNSMAIGPGSVVTANNTIVIGTAAQKLSIPGTFTVANFTSNGQIWASTYMGGYVSVGNVNTTGTVNAAVLRTDNGNAVNLAVTNLFTTQRTQFGRSNIPASGTGVALDFNTYKDLTVVTLTNSCNIVMSNLRSCCKMKLIAIHSNTSAWRVNFAGVRVVGQSSVNLAYSVLCNAAASSARTMFDIFYDGVDTYVQATSFSA